MKTFWIVLVLSFVCLFAASCMVDLLEKPLRRDD